MNNRSLSLALAAVVVVACAACMPPGKPSPTGPGVADSSVSHPAAGPVAASTPVPAPVASDYAFSPGPGLQAPSATAPAPGASWSAAAEGDALATATKAMVLFARPDEGEPTWFEDLKPYLTVDAADSFSYTDPANVPVHQVKGAGALVKDAGNPFGALISFATDAGTYSVQVVRSGDGAPWQVAAIAPAGNQ